MICTSTTSYRRKKWIVAPAPHADQTVEDFAASIRQPPLIARLLLNRGIDSPAAADGFLNPRFRDLHPPRLLPNIDRAAERIAQAVRNGEKITLYGDYDVDGITGTAMLWHILKAANAQVDTYIPHRVDEGYGLNRDAIDSLINAGTQLLITVDCGCSAVEPITHAKERGIDVIVSDHHEFAPTLPPAYAIVHPKAPWLDGAGTNYPNTDLCGAGVAFKLAWAIAQKLCNAERVSDTFRDLLVEFAALVGLGTVADVVPLTGENRILVKYGLSQITRTRIDGLRALIHAAGFGEGEGQKKIDCMAIGFSLAPRLNAAGRMGHAREAVELLTTATGDRADEIAQYLEAQNRTRQSTEKKMADRAKQQIEDRKSQIQHQEEVILVASHETFHAGVVGIVASRLVDLYHRPAFVLAAAESGECHGSARSIPGFALHQAIEHVRDLLISGGGHAMAGGVRLASANLDAFRTRLNAYARELLTEDDLVPAMTVDAEIELADCTALFVKQIESLEPFGRGNPQPRFLLQNMRLTAPPRRVGATGSHLQLTLAAGTRVQRCIAFRMGELAPQLPVGCELNLVVELRINSWQGREQVDLSVVDIAKTDGEPFLPAR